MASESDSNAMLIFALYSDSDSLSSDVLTAQLYTLSTRRVNRSILIFVGVIQVDDALLFLRAVKLANYKYNFSDVTSRNLYILCEVLAAGLTTIGLERGRSYTVPSLASFAVQARSAILGLALGRVSIDLRTSLPNMRAGTA